MGECSRLPAYRGCSRSASARCTTLVLCTNLAALATRGNVREDFRRRGLGIGMVAGVVSVFTLVLLIADAPRL